MAKTKKIQVRNFLSGKMLEELTDSFGSDYEWYGKPFACVAKVDGELAAAVLGYRRCYGDDGESSVLLAGHKLFTDRRHFSISRAILNSFRQQNIRMGLAYSRSGKKALVFVEESDRKPLFFRT